MVIPLRSHQLFCTGFHSIEIAVFFVATLSSLTRSSLLMFVCLVEPVIFKGFIGYNMDGFVKRNICEESGDIIGNKKNIS